MPIQATVVLDSGAFFTDITKPLTFVDVGYFLPDIHIYGDCQEIAHIPPDMIGTGGSIVEIFEGNNGGINISPSLRSHLLSINSLYENPVRIDKSKYHCTFRFHAGFFCPSMTKNRKFKEMGKTTRAPTGNSQQKDSIAHDVNIHYKLTGNDALRIVQDGRELWSSVNFPLINDRFDIQILAENATAEMFYKEALIIDGDHYWLPNQGDPPPGSDDGPPE